MTDDLRSSDEHELKASLRALAREDATLEAGSDVEARVMRAWDAAPAGAAVRRRFAPRVLQVAAAAVLVAVGGYWWAAMNRPSASPAVVDRAEFVAESGVPSDEIQAWLDLDPGSLQIVRVAVSRATLAAQGYPVSDADGDGLVEIDLVVGADGVARTVQLAAAPFY